MIWSRSRLSCSSVILVRFMNLSFITFAKQNKRQKKIQGDHFIIYTTWKMNMMIWKNFINIMNANLEDGQKLHLPDISTF